MTKDRSRTKADTDGTPTVARTVGQRHTDIEILPCMLVVQISIVRILTSLSKLLAPSSSKRPLMDKWVTVLTMLRDGKHIEGIPG